MYFTTINGLIIFIKFKSKICSSISHHNDQPFKFLSLSSRASISEAIEGFLSSIPPGGGGI